MQLLHKARARQVLFRELAAIFADPASSTEDLRIARASMARASAAGEADLQHWLSLELQGLGLGVEVVDLG